MMRALFLLAAAVLASWPVDKLQAAESADFFGLTNLWTIHLTFDRAHWDALNQVQVNRRSGGVGPHPDQRNGGPRAGGPGAFEHEFPWTTCTFECDGRKLTNVGIRFKGNSSFAMSRQTLKSPFKVKFSRGQKGRQFLGVDELSLNNNFNDSTQFREALAYDVCRQAGLPAPRTAFARVYLTVAGQRTYELLGLYTLAEPVKNDFLKTHFGSKEGLLLKPERLPSLEYLGENWAAYTNRYEPKTDAKPEEIKRFIALTRLIARADNAALDRELPSQIDMENLLRYIAVNALLANYDSFVGNGHNYYLFMPAKGGKAVFIPWDLNEAFGGHPPLGPRLRQAELSVLQPQAGDNRLIERVMANPKWAADYRRELANLLTNACAPARLQALATRLTATARATVYAESPVSKAAFQRTALGQIDTPIPSVNPGRGGMSGINRIEPPLADWISFRMQNAADELAGKRTGTRVRMRGFGGPPRPPPP